MRLRPAGEPYNRKTLSKVKRSGVRAQVGAGPGRGRGQPRSRPEGLRPPRCTHPGVQSGAGEVGILHSLPFTPPLQVPHLPSLPRPGEPLLGIPPSTRGFGPDISASSALSLLPGAPRACCVPSSLSPRRPWLLRAPSRSPPADLGHRGRRRGPGPGGGGAAVHAQPAVAGAALRFLQRLAGSSTGPQPLRVTVPPWGAPSSKNRALGQSCLRGSCPLGSRCWG